MGSAPLTGRVILIVEDEPLIAMDLDATFESAGARVINATTTHAALAIAEDGDLAAAVVDYGLADGNSTEMCARLQSLKIPFMMYSGYPHPMRVRTPCSCPSRRVAWRPADFVQVARRLAGRVKCWVACCCAYLSQLAEALGSGTQLVRSWDCFLEKIELTY